MSKSTKSNLRNVYTILIFSLLAVAGLLFIIYRKESVPNTNEVDGSILNYFVLLNIILNSATIICILLGRLAIKNRKIFLHKKFMLSAFTFSVLFLISYIYYHYNYGATLFLGQGIIRPIYFFILISHIILAAITLPMVLVTLYFALFSQFILHKAIANYTFYAWLYVSITGILIYLLLHLFNN